MNEHCRVGWIASTYLIVPCFCNQFVLIGFTLSNKRVFEDET